jgi:hypothetical protein
MQLKHCTLIKPTHNTNSKWQANRLQQQQTSTATMCLA